MSERHFDSQRNRDALDRHIEREPVVVEPPQTLVRDWMDAHGIDYRVASDAGLHATRQDGIEILHAPYYTVEGEKFERTRRFPEGPWKQPAGQSLRLFWPLQTAVGAYVLLCEGEGDTLCAASILANTEHPGLNGLCPVGLPGASMNAIAVVASLILFETKRVYVCLDGDEAGRNATAKIVKRAAAASLDVVPVNLPDGIDLSEYLTASYPSTPEEKLANLLADADVEAETNRENIVMGSIKDKLNIKQSDAGAFDA